MEFMALGASSVCEWWVLWGASGLGGWPVDLPRVGEFAENRFRQIRPGESWSLPELDCYRLGKMVVIDIEPDQLLCEDFRPAPTVISAVFSPVPFNVGTNYAVVTCTCAFTLADVAVSLASVMGPGCCHEEGTTLGHE
jgi:hypothetical protein